MSERLMSRRKFLVGAGTIVGAASVSGLVLAEKPAPAQAATTSCRGHIRRMPRRIRSAAGSQQDG